jgi:hypothetical protein
MIKEWAYCNSLRRSDSPGSSASFSHVCHVTDPQGLRRVQDAEIDLTDSGVCSEEGGYRPRRSNPLKMIEDMEITIFYDPGDPGHQKIVEDMRNDHTPETCYYWDMVDPNNTETVRWRCKAWVVADQDMFPIDAARQLTFTLRFTGQPLVIHGITQ